MAADYDLDYGPPSHTMDGDYFISDTDFSYADPNKNFVLRGSVGVTSIEAKEKVFNGNGDDLLSLLVWQSTAPIASGDAKLRFPGDWTLRGHLDAAIGGDSFMTDSDWTAGYIPDLWTDRSVHPNTRLDWYLNGDVAFGRDLPINDALRLNVNGGVKYTDVKWTAVGGSFIYSDLTFRDTTGTFADIPVGDYRMQLPTAYLGIDANVDDGPWSLETSARAGLTVFAGDVDNHFLRDIRFIDQLNWSQVYSAEARLGYDFSDHLGVFLEGTYETMFSGHGDEDVYDTTTGALTGHYVGAIGGELQMMSLKAGLKGNF